ncbi:hypothetical protein NDNC_0230 [Candidatus Nasuia deltocephalinicola]|nr:hypothetical protein NDNC_0230 [Candidatus Nasuia deltocephalinicola]
MKIKNILQWIKEWIYSKKNNIIFLIILIKKKNIKIIIIKLIIKSKNIFYYKFSIILNKIKVIIIENLKKIKKNKKNLRKIEIIDIIFKNNTINYKIEMNNNIEKYKNIYLIIKNDLKLWKKENRKLMIIIILILTNLISLNIKIIKNKKLNIKNKICGSIFKNINTINIQIINYLMEWIIKLSNYLKEKIYL